MPFTGGAPRIRTEISAPSGVCVFFFCFFAWALRSMTLDPRGVFDAVAWVGGREIAEFDVLLQPQGLVYSPCSRRGAASRVITPAVMRSGAFFFFACLSL